MTASEIRALFSVASRPEVVSLAGGMPYLSALPMDTVAETVQQMLVHAGRHRAAVRLRPGRPAAARADPRGDGAGGHPGPRRRHHRHHGLAAGARPGHPHLHRPRRRHPGRGAELRGGARGLRGVPGPGGARDLGRRGPGPRCARGAHRRPRGGRPVGSSSSTPCRPSPTRPAPRSRCSGDRRSWTSARGTASSCSRTTPTACWASTSSRTPRCAPSPRTAWSTSGPSPRRSRRGCGWAGPSPRTPCARSWCSPPSRRSCARAPTPR